MAFKLTEAGLFVSGHDVASWTFVTPKIRIDTRLAVTDSGVRSTNGYNTRHATQFSPNIYYYYHYQYIIIISIIIIIIF